MTQYLLKFLYVLGQKKFHLIFIALLFLLTSLLDTIGIGLVGPFIVFASSPESVHKNYWINVAYNLSNLGSEPKFIVFLGCAIVLIFYGKSFLSFYVQRHVFRFSYNQQGALSNRLLQSYLSAPYTFHLNKNTALLTQNIISESRNFSNGIMLPILNSLAYSIITGFLVLLLIKTSPISASGILLLLFIPFLIYQNSKHKLKQWGKQTSIAQLGVLRTINHSLGALKETRVIGCAPYFEEQMSHYTHLYETTVSESQVFKLLPRILIEAILITFLVGLASVFLFSNNHDSQSLTAVLSVFALASIRLIPAISQLTTAMGTLRNSSYTLNKLYYDLKELEALEHTLADSADSKNLSQVTSEQSAKYTLPFDKQITLSKLQYSYPNISELALKDISFNLKKGQSIALIGRSGAGKTTLVDVILGLLKPTGGSIEVDGVSVYTNLRAWQNLVGYIPQSIFLMDDTLAKNIAFGVPDEQINSERLEKAIQAAQLTELIEELPDGIHTVVGERGIRLSGGQRQRVGIARALYHEREILILDEATAALDNETEKLVNEAIKSLGGTKTLIIIAHRLTTVEHCNCIYLMEKGRIVKSGTYQEVVLGEIVSHEK